MESPRRLERIEPETWYLWGEDLLFTLKGPPWEDGSMPAIAWWQHPLGLRREAAGFVTPRGGLQPAWFTLGIYV